MRWRHYSRRTEQAYSHWIRRFVHLHTLRQPQEVAEAEVTDLLDHLAAQRGGPAMVRATSGNGAEIRDVRHLGAQWGRDAVRGARVGCNRYLASLFSTNRAKKLAP